MNTTYPVELHIDAAGIADRLVILGAGTGGDPDSVINSDGTAWDIVLAVEPSEDFEPYAAAMRSAGFEPVGNDAARRAGHRDDVGPWERMIGLGGGSPTE